MTVPIAAVIVDDEPLAAEGLRRLCDRSGRVAIQGEARDGAAGLALIVDCAPQAVFLDIAMPGMTGLEVAAALARLARPPKIVLVTAHDHFATEAFDLGVVDYVLKPLVAERVDRAIDRLAATIGEGAGKASELWVPHRGTIVRLPVESIRRIDAERDYVRLHDAERSYLLRATIGDILARLDPARFVRIHRSTIMAVDCIAGLRHAGGGAWVTIDDAGEEARIGRNYLTVLRERFGLADPS